MASGADWVVPAVSVVGSGAFGAVAVEILRGRRESKVNEIEVPAQAEQTISAGARDAVEAIRATLAELRNDLAAQQAKCDTLETKLEETKVELARTRDDLAEARSDAQVAKRRAANLAIQVAELRREIGSQRPKEGS